MKITLEKIKELNPCKDGLDWYLQHPTEDLKETLVKANNHNPDWARWLFVRLMNKKQHIEISIYAAELVLPIFEDKYPKDDRPRKAIEAAKKITFENQNTVLATAPTDAFAAFAIASAPAAAFAFAAATYAAASAASCTAYATYAAEASVSAVDASANKKEIEQKIILKAVEILDGG